MTEYIETMKKISGQIWTVFKTNLPMKNDDEYIEDLSKQFKEVTEPYRGTRYEDFVGDMFCTFMSELKRVWKETFPEEAEKYEKGEKD